MQISIISLGCCKNRVDTEQMLYALRQAGHTFVEETDAEAVVINTCGFLAAAKQEALETIAQAYQSNPAARIIVTGCLGQREPQLLQSTPGVSAVLGVGEHLDITKALTKSSPTSPPETKAINSQALCQPRLLSTPPYLAYLRISDGCDNRCAYCAIPDIRGPYRSAPFEDVINEAKQFVKNGVKELCVVAQDTTRYGIDLHPAGKAPRLAELLCALADIDSGVWVRFLYAYPEMITPQLLGAIESRPNICRYIDVPIQHTHDDILSAMNRRSTAAQLKSMVESVRSRKEKYALRTTVICGFPGETPAHHRDMLKFLQEHPFDRLGGFAYSREAGTPAHGLPGQLDEKTKQKRLKSVMRQQERIAKALQKTRMGGVEDVLIEGALSPSYPDEAPIYIGRSQYEAPEIDGKIYITSRQPLVSGQIISVKITGAQTHDLIGEAR
ncbi:MAG: 30S ribosomal protein S12 methylthiotransferase RimO [Clostridia bacterium]|nr:30S ribosomal protein S12 methylthiotransferase RimO [Clostridia bacterium]